MDIQDGQDNEKYRIGSYSFLFFGFSQGSDFLAVKKANLFSIGVCNGALYISGRLHGSSFKATFRANKCVCAIFDIDAFKRFLFSYFFVRHRAMPFGAIQRFHDDSSMGRSWCRDTNQSDSSKRANLKYILHINRRLSITKGKSSRSLISCL